MIYMKKAVRDYLKQQKGIEKIMDEDQEERCKTCLFHSREKVCQIHGLKTHVDEICPRYTFPARNKVYLGGRMP